jgi:hypothetical protein
MDTRAREPVAACVAENPRFVLLRAAVPVATEHCAVAEVVHVAVAARREELHARSVGPTAHADTYGAYG